MVTHSSATTRQLSWLATFYRGSRFQKRTIFVLVLACLCSLLVVFRSWTHLYSSSTPFDYSTEKNDSTDHSINHHDENNKQLNDKIFPKDPPVGEYETNTCRLLDSPFEYHSPPDFTKLRGVVDTTMGINPLERFWPDCRLVQSIEGWKVEHCTVPRSTWATAVGSETNKDLIKTGVVKKRQHPRSMRQRWDRHKTPPKDQQKPKTLLKKRDQQKQNRPTQNQQSSQGQEQQQQQQQQQDWSPVNRFLSWKPFSNPPPILGPSTFAWDQEPDTEKSSKPSIFEASTKEPMDDTPQNHRGIGQPNHCDPSGYFRIQRLVPFLSTNTTFGSEQSSQLRCRNNFNKHLVSVNENTRRYIDQFIGPDSFRIELYGPERLILSQQINLGNCSYGLPYVLSRPGKFFLHKVDLLYQDFQGFDENFLPDFYPDDLQLNILGTTKQRPPPPPLPEPEPEVEEVVVVVEEVGVDAPVVQDAVVVVEESVLVDQGVEPEESVVEHAETNENKDGVEDDEHDEHDEHSEYDGVYYEEYDEQDAKDEEHDEHDNGDEEEEHLVKKQKQKQKNNSQQKKQPRERRSEPPSAQKTLSHSSAFKKRRLLPDDEIIEGPWDEARYAREAAVYSFQVCAGCTEPSSYPPLSLESFTTLPICSSTPRDGARQYGIYAALGPAKEVIKTRSAGLLHDYQWISVRPRCRSLPDLTVFMNESIFDQVVVPKMVDQVMKRQQHHRHEQLQRQQNQEDGMMIKMKLRMGKMWENVYGIKKNVDSFLSHRVVLGNNGDKSFVDRDSHNNNNNNNNNNNVNNIYTDNKLYAQLDLNTVNASQLRSHILDLHNQAHTSTTRCFQTQPRNLYFVGDSHIRTLFYGFQQHLNGITGHTDPPFIDGATHFATMDTISMQQDYDTFLIFLRDKISYSLGIPLKQGDEMVFGKGELSKENNELNHLSTVDSIVVGFGHWAAVGYSISRLWSSSEFLNRVIEILWGLAEIRARRQEEYQKTGKGLKDLKIVWIGMTAWTERTSRQIPDMRTNPRLKYWDTLINDLIQEINDYYRKERGKLDGMVDRMESFNIDLPYRRVTGDGSHYCNQRPMESVVQSLMHKWELCSEDSQDGLGGEVEKNSG